MPGPPANVFPRPREFGYADRVLDHPLIMATRFADTELYHPRLIGKILELERRPRIRKQYFRGACGTKVHHVDRWNFSEANLIHARALELFQRALKRNEAVTDLC